MSLIAIAEAIGYKNFHSQSIPVNKFPLEMASGGITSDLYSFALSANDRSDPELPEIPSVLSVLSSLVERAVARNRRIYSPALSSSRQERYRVFDAVEVPRISIERYLQRIFKYLNCSPSVLVVAYAYIDRLMQFHPEFRITCMNVHSLLVTAIMAASKFLEDLNHRNSYYARVGGFDTQEINRLEIAFLFMMNFKLQVTVSVFESYSLHLQREVAFGGGFQIERTLRSVCGGDHENAAEELSLKQRLALIRCEYRRAQRI